MESNPTCRTIGAVVNLAGRAAETPVIYRNEECWGCGVDYILEDRQAYAHQS